ncbi:MAG: hypothetical protein DHS20C21_19770 [Gemmatimonadota bacterium]|nr:MAG: hypothetical protein DHS20C21_19770 [Gemmatimonadota bacterium]
MHPQQVATTCGTCHSNETIMKKYGLGTDQVAGYEKSVHGLSVSSGRDLSSPTCNDCHGDHGALPPTVESSFAVCGHCHVHNRELYASSRKRAAFDDLGEPGCVACHGHHEILAPSEEMLSLDPDSYCADCHDDDGSEASTAILRMRASLDSLRLALERGEIALDEAEQKGMYVTEIRFDLQEPRQRLVRARTEVHGFTAAAVEEICGEGQALADSVIHAAQGALDEYRFRRSGLAVATLLISAFAWALYRKIRTLD